MLDHLASVILAAGKGTRMKSKLPKVLHKVCDKTMLDHVIIASKNINAREIVIIVGHEADMVVSDVKNKFSNKDEATIRFAIQEPQLGTGHAVQQAEKALQDFPDDGQVIVLSGDVPLVKSSHLKEMIRQHREGVKTENRIATMMTSNAVNPTGYGRVMRDTNGVCGIVEEKDIVLDAIRNIKEINCGIYVFQKKYLFETLKRVDNKNRQKEYYLPRVLELWISDGLKVGTWTNPDMSTTLGVNTIEQLKEVEEIMLGSKAKNLYY
tara:strand:- start:1190 stop:1987 length:798 start_codon:yes stop_codon:yes gene_type:complete